MAVLIVLGGSGGLIGIFGAVWLVGRAIFRQVTATEENTVAMTKLSGQMEAIMTRLNQHEVDIAVLKERNKMS